MVDSVYSLMLTDRLGWEQKSSESFRSKAGTVRIDLDRSAVGDRVAYVLWIWGPNGDLAGRIDGQSLTQSPPSGEPNYQALLKKMFELANQHVKATAMETALQAVEEFRGSNS